MGEITQKRGHSRIGNAHPPRGTFRGKVGPVSIQMKPPPRNSTGNDVEASVSRQCRRLPCYSVLKGGCFRGGDHHRRCRH